LLKLFLFATFVAMPSLAMADDTLRFHLDKADLVLVVECTAGHPTGQFSLSERGQLLNHSVKFKTLQSIKGHLKPGAHLDDVEIQTNIGDQSRLPEIKKGKNTSCSSRATAFRICGLAVSGIARPLLKLWSGK
jgi:hypothetical protein